MKAQRGDGRGGIQPAPVCAWSPAVFLSPGLWASGKHAEREGGGPFPRRGPRGHPPSLGRAGDVAPRDSSRSPIWEGHPWKRLVAPKPQVWSPQSHTEPGAWGRTGGSQTVPTVYVRSRDTTETPVQSDASLSEAPELGLLGSPEGLLGSQEVVGFACFPTGREALGTLKVGASVSTV